jgi:hypothetical protein
MNHPYINSTRVLFSILIIFLFYLCSPDETKLNDNQIFKQHYSLDQYEDSYGEVKGNLTIEWDNFTTSEVEGVKYYEFSTTSKYKDSIVFEMLRSDIIFKLLAWVDTDHLPQLRIVKLLPFKEYEEVDASYINPQNYTGVAYLYDMQAELLQLNIYEYGEKIDALENEELQNKLPNLRTAYCGDMTRQAQGPDNMVRTVSCEGGGGCGYSTRTVNMYTKWYDVYYVNNQPVFAVYLRTTFEGSRTEQYYSCSGGNSSVTQYREELIPKYPEGDIEQKFGKLCDNINFKYSGSSFKAELIGLGSTYVNHSTNQILNIELGVNCIDIPDYYIGTSYDAAMGFSQIFNNSRTQIEYELESATLQPTVVAVRSRLVTVLTTRLQAAYPGATFGLGGCQGDIPKTVADYGC